MRHLFKHHSIKNGWLIELVRIFIAHSSEDEWLFKPIADNLRLIGVEPYLAKLEDPTPCALPQKLDSAIQSSAAMFVFLTPSVAENKGMRDVINWEISSAYAKRRPIYVFREKGVEVPLMVNYITVYATYDPISRESLNKMVNKVQEIAHAFKESEDKAKAAFAMIGVFLGLLFIGSLLAGD